MLGSFCLCCIFNMKEANECLGFCVLGMLKFPGMGHVCPPVPFTTPFPISNVTLS